MSKTTQFLLSAAVVLSLGTVSVSADRTTGNQHGPGTATDNISSTTTVGKGFIADGTDATSAAVGRSTAEFQVAPGDLTLDAVPNLKFAGTNVSDIIKDDTTLNYVSGSVNANENYDGNSKAALSVTDFTGSSNGWHVLASLGQFSNSAKGTITDASLTLAPNTTTSDSGLNKPGSVTLAATAANDANKGVQENSVWQASAGKGQGQNTTTYNTDATKLLVKKQTAVQPGTYQATLYWSLVNAPTAMPAKA
ncbi:WxL domain-containing protein [Furfurilactobacillus siliginis]|uniref:Cell surface protein n=1 Tax=Furfurilactobacillus siliginis TaxID=348151 RepID=A0A0R2LCL2_9LACO|nr:WxL domain-containing protein [Furfurilactobacillus siliginis]KRN96365.1 hypothetical protein IV55_GL001327 [Furfurilactobacillus siliginis]GEK29218.1 cell surface protein [Furfurilactobacillus siliginis]